MFLLMLGGSLVFGTGLLAAASYSGGTLLALKTAAQIIGWLFVLATVAGAIGLRRDSLGRLGAATVTLVSGLSVLYVSYFQWEAPPEPIANVPIRVAPADALPVRPVAYDRIDLSPKVIPQEPARPPRRAKPLVAATAAAPAPIVASPCATLTGLESVECKRCRDKSGISWLACREKARLEYCEGAQADAAACPSAIPSTNVYSPPA
jgi:hypothetical protein